jgi:ssDNA-binding Zn-finger/Zn-ribbon topoisomerase 1
MNCPKCGSEMVKIREMGIDWWWCMENPDCGHEEKVGEKPKTVLLCDDPLCFAGWAAEHLLDEPKKKVGGEKR